MLVFNLRRFGMCFLSGFTTVFSEIVDSMDGVDGHDIRDCLNTVSTSVFDMSLYAMYFEETCAMVDCSVLSPLAAPEPSTTCCSVFEETGSLGRGKGSSEIDDLSLGFSRFISLKFCQIKK